MSDTGTMKRNRISLSIPYSLLEKVDQHVDKMHQDGESRETANRTAFVMQMVKLGLRVYENKINQDPREKTLDQKLELIARNAMMSGLITDAIFGLLTETVDTARVIKNRRVLESEWIREINERVAGKLQHYFN